MEKKPLIVVNPMSPSTKKLVEVLNGIAEEESIEIYILDELNELGQLLPTLGQSLTIASNPKKCAMLLQENRWAIGKNHSKVILITPKEIPLKTIVKLQKIGLTESILESVPPKTLLHKVRLLLRAIKATNKEEQEIAVKSMSDAIQQNHINNNQEQRIEKGIIADSVSQDQKGKEKKDVQLDLQTEDLYARKKKETNQDNVIDTHWKTKKKDTEINLDLTKEKSDEDQSGNINEIQTYYKTKRENSLDLQMDESGQLRKAKDSREDENDSYGNFQRKKIEETEIELERERKKAEAAEELAAEGFVRRKIVNETELNLERDRAKRDIEEESVAAKKEKPSKEETININLDFSKDDKPDKEENPNEIETHWKGKVNTELVLEDGEKGKINAKNESNIIESDAWKGKLSQSETQIEFEKDHKRPEQDQDQEDLTNGTHRKSAKDKSDSELDFEKEKKDQEEENELSERDNLLKLKKIDSTEIDFDQEEGPEQIDEDDSSSHLNRKKTENLIDIEFEKNKKDELDQQQEEVGRGIMNQRQIQETNIDFERDKKNQDENDEESKNSSLELLKTNSTHIDFDTNNEDEKKNLENSDLGALSLKKSNSIDLDLMDGNGKFKDHENKVEHIDKYMRSKNLHQEHDWSNLNNKKKVEDIKLEFSQAKENELNLNRQFKDAGEITIDYRKLKEEFDQISKYGQSQSDESIGATKNNYRDNEIDKDPQIYVPTPQGLDAMIEIIDLYYKNDKKPSDIFKETSKMLLTQEKAITIFFQGQNESDKLEEKYNSMNDFSDGLISEEFKNNWKEYKSSQTFKDFRKKTMETWICQDVDGNGKYWEDIELPSWAAQNLNNREVILIYPYIDGLSYMGMAFVIFPLGVNHQSDKKIQIILEAARGALLETGSKKNELSEAAEKDNEKDSKGGISGFLSKFLGPKKVG